MRKFVFFGTPYVASDTLAVLLERGYRPVAVVTAPDAPKGRGQVVSPCETKAFALQEGLPVMSPAKLDAGALEEIRSLGADYAIVVAYGKILPQELLALFPMGALNVHYSLLPKYRGASPVEAALLNGDTMTGVAIQKMVYELDAGDLIALEEVSILPAETTRELRPRLVQIGAELLADTLPSFEEGMSTPHPQDHAKATRTGKIAKGEGLLDLAGDALLNWRKYRAYAESPGTYFFMDKNGMQVRVKIKTATYQDGAFVPLRVVPEGKGETDYQTLAH